MLKCTFSKPAALTANLVNIKLVYCWHKTHQQQLWNADACLISGDEVLQWNGKLLPGATMKEVYNIILESQAEPQVELVVSRPIG